MDFKTLADDIAELNALKAELKERSMIYQCEMKEMVARWFGEPTNKYYDYDLEKWERVRGKFEQESEEMFMNIREVEKYHKLSKNSLEALPINQWKDKYRAWRDKK
jgi:hypothetical protein